MKSRTGLIVIGFFIQCTTMSFGRFAYTLILPAMMKDLHFSTTLMGLLGTGIVMGYLYFSYKSGVLSCTLGPYLTVKLSILLVSISLFCLGYFSRYFALLASSLGLGAGAAGSYIPLIHIMNKRFRGRGKAFGLVMGGAGAGIMLSGYIIPQLLRVGYRPCWYALSGINTVVLIIVLVFMKAGEDGMKLVDGNHRIGFMAPFRGNRPLMLTTIVYMLVGFSYIIYITYFGPYSIDELGYTERTTGIMWSLFGLNTVYSGLFWGTIADRKGSAKTACIVTGLLTLSVALIIPSSAKPVLYLSTFLFGLSFLGFITVIVSIISAAVEQQVMGAVFGTATLLHGGGQVLGASSAGVLKDLSGTFRVPLSLSVLLLLCCIILLLRLMSTEAQGVYHISGLHSREKY
jgi:MFS family permease